MKITTLLQDIYQFFIEQDELTKASEEYWNVHKKSEEIYKELDAQLTEEQKDLLDKLCFQWMGLESEMSETHFIAGLKAGFKLCGEIME